MSVNLTLDSDRPHVAHLTVDFGKLNLLTADRLAELEETLRDLPEQVAVLTIAPEHPTDELTGLTGGLHLERAKDMSVVEARDVLTTLHGTMQTVRNLDAVTVCDCGTHALGAGFELALSCDFRVATRDAALGLPEIDVGLVTGIEGGLLVRFVGLQRAKELIYLGEPIDGEQAAAEGLVNEATTPETHDDALERIVERLAEKEPLILQYQTEVFRQWRSNGLETGMDHSLELIAACFGTDAQSEAMEGFLDGE